MTTSEFIGKVKEQMSKITPGKWMSQKTSSGGAIISGGNPPFHGFSIQLPHEQDAQFIASSPETISKLIQMLDVAMERLNRIESECSRHDSTAYNIAGDALFDVERIAGGEG